MDARISKWVAPGVGLFAIAAAAVAGCEVEGPPDVVEQTEEPLQIKPDLTGGDRRMRCLSH